MVRFVAYFLSVADENDLLRFESLVEFDVREIDEDVTDDDFNSVHMMAGGAA
jgi:hypothetical protein